MQAVPTWLAAYADQPAALRAALPAASAATPVDADDRALNPRRFVTDSTLHDTPREPPVTLGNAD